MSAVTISQRHFMALLCLLDDTTPEVRQSVARELDRFGGDVSHLLSESGRQLTETESRTLRELLHPARQRHLETECVVPEGGAAALHDDWDHVEWLFRALSNFLHDGISVRPTLNDALDRLEDLCAPLVESGGPLVMLRYLLREVLCADREEQFSPAHYDLAAVAEGGPSNALGMGALCLLLAHRLNVDIRGISLPGSFLLALRVGEEKVVIIDPANKGALVEMAEFAHRIRRYPEEVHEWLSRPLLPGDLLRLVAEELATVFTLLAQSEDAALVALLAVSLESDD